MVRIGLVGIGFMGMIHYLAYQRVKGAKVVAICSRNEKKRAGDWRGIQGNFGPPGAQMDLKGIQAYTSTEDLFADPNVDLVDICLPPSMHAQATVAAHKAGKHVLCEKPIALSTADANRMVQAAEQAGKLLFIGHVLPYFPEYAHALKLIQSGKYGKLLGGHFKRVISDPLWLKDFYNPNLVGGPVVDLHIHDAHFIRLLFGQPDRVFSRGRTRGEVVEYCHSQFLMADPALVVSSETGVIHQQGRPFTHGFEIHLEKATLMYESAVLGGKGVTTMPLTVLDSKGQVLQPDLGQADPVTAFVGELTEVVKCHKAGKPSGILAGSLAKDALHLCHKESQSVIKGGLVKV